MLDIAAHFKRMFDIQQEKVPVKGFHFFVYLILLGS